MFQVSVVLGLGRNKLRAINRSTNYRDLVLFGRPSVGLYIGKCIGLSIVTPPNLTCYTIYTSAISLRKYPTKLTYFCDRPNEHVSTTTVSGKYRIFCDEDAPTILDIEEERNLKASANACGAALTPLSNQLEIGNEVSGQKLQRGDHGIFDIEELVNLLRRDKAQDTFVAKLASELNYVDFIVVITGKSQRHMLAMARFVRKVFKEKMQPKDVIPRIEGENSRDWIALDLGNIALHIFSKAARHVYDLDSLWAVGSEYDDQCNKPEDPLITLLQRHAIYLGDLQPNET